MGFDVTFHPVSLAAVQHAVFDVANAPALAAARAKALASSKAKRDDLTAGVLNRLGDFVGEVQESGGFGETIAFATAAVAGYLHPYWYARGSALSFLAAEDPSIVALFTSWQGLATGVVSTLSDDSAGLITANYSASGFITPEKLVTLQALLANAKKKSPFFEVFDEDGFDALRRAVDYAAAHGLGLMEASDLVVPMTNEGFTDLDNLRAHFLNNVDYAKPGVPPLKRKTPAKKRPASKAKPPPKPKTAKTKATPRKPKKK